MPTIAEDDAEFHDVSSASGGLPSALQRRLETGTDGSDDDGAIFEDENDVLGGAPDDESGEPVQRQLSGACSYEFMQATSMPASLQARLSGVPTTLTAAQIEVAVPRSVQLEETDENAPIVQTLRECHLLLANRCVMMHDSAK